VKVVVLATAWHTQIMDGLLAGAERELRSAGNSDFKVHRIPGAFELPLAAKWAFEAGADVVIALGVVIRGGTPHFEYVSSAVTDGLRQVQLEAGKPVGFGVLTVDTEQQALDRAGLASSSEDKGREAVQAAIAMHKLSQNLH
jgi:6,7-dimethyl-8-ribityllumazine synthase